MSLVHGINMAILNRSKAGKIDFESLLHVCLSEFCLSELKSLFNVLAK